MDLEAWAGADRDLLTIGHVLGVQRDLDMRSLPRRAPMCQWCDALLPRVKKYAEPLCRGCLYRSRAGLTREQAVVRQMKCLWRRRSRHATTALEDDRLLFLLALLKEMGGEELTRPG